MTAPNATIGGVESGLVTVLAHVEAGALLIQTVWERAGAGVPTHTLQSGWTQILSQSHDDGSTDGRLSIAYKVQATAIVATPTNFQAYTTSGSGTVVCQTIVVDPKTYTSSGGAPTGIVSASVSGTTNAAPNPPNITGLTGDYLIIAYGGWHLSAVTAPSVLAPVAPTNYTIVGDPTEGTQLFDSDAFLELSYRTRLGLSAASEDPSAWADGIAPNGTTAATLAIRGTTWFGANGPGTTGIASAEAFGSATVDNRRYPLDATGIASAEAFGTATTEIPGMLIPPNNIASAEAFGKPAISGGTVASQTPPETNENFSTPQPGMATVETEQTFRTGDCVVVVTWEVGATIPNHTLQSGWKEILSHAHDDGTTDGRLSIAYRIIPESKSSTALQPYTSDGSGTKRTQVLTYLGANSYAFDPATRELIGYVVSSVTNTTNAAPNPPSITGMIGDFRVYCIGAWQLEGGATVLVSTMPSGYTTGGGTVGGTDAHFRWGYRTTDLVGQSYANTEDPGTITDDVAPNGTVAVTLAFKGNIHIGRQQQERGTQQGAQTITSAEAFGIGELAHIQSIAPSGIASAEAFGTASLERSIAGTGITSAEAFGTASLERSIAGTGIASAEAFGTASIESAVSINGTGIPSEEAFGSSTLDLYLDGTGATSGEAFGSPTLDLYLDGTGIASEEAFGTASLDLYLDGTGIVSEEAFGSPTLDLYLDGTGVASEEAFGTATVESSQEVLATGIPSEEALGSPSLELVLDDIGIASEEAFGTGAIDQYLDGTIASEEAFGTASLDLYLDGVGIATEEAFGSSTLDLYLDGTGIGTEEAFGSPDVFIVQVVDGTGISSDEAFGTHDLALLLDGTGIASEEAFGSHSLLPSQEVTGTGIPSEEAFGSPTLDLYLDGTIASEEAFGTASLDQYLDGTGVPSDEAFGDPSFSLLVDLSGVPSEEAFGDPNLDLFIGGVGVASEELFGTATLVLYVDATGIVTGEALGSPTLLLAALLDGTGIPSEEAFGLGEFARFVDLVSIPSDETFGSHSFPLFVDLTGIPSEEAFGTSQVDQVGAIAPTGIPSEEAIGAATVEGGAAPITTIPAGGRAQPKQTIAISITVETVSSIEITAEVI